MTHVAEEWDDYTLHRSDTGRWTLYGPDDEIPVDTLWLVQGNRTRIARDVAAAAIAERTGHTPEWDTEDYDGLGDLQYHTSVPRRPASAS